MRLGRCKPGIQRALRASAYAALLAGVTAMAGMTHAAMQLDRTRVIVTQTGGSAIVQVKNTGQTPVLLQAWIEPGENAVNSDTAVTSVQAETPFIVEPPVLYMAGEETQALRVWLADPPETLPQDRESQFWLSVLELDAEALLDDGEDGPQNNRLDFNILTQIKLFYRPKALADYKRSEEDKLRFTLERDAENQVWLNIHNPAPIYQSLDKLVLHYQDAKDSMTLDAPMVAPFGKTRIKAVKTNRSLFLLTGQTSPNKWSRIQYAILDDMGRVVEDEQKL